MPGQLSYIKLPKIPQWKEGSTFPLSFYNVDAKDI
jgi:hypothetical protein